MDNEVDQVLSLVTRLSAEVPHSDYVEFLGRLADEIDVMLDAAKND